jgi:hypothetical protein
MERNCIYIKYIKGNVRGKAGHCPFLKRYNFIVSSIMPFFGMIRSLQAAKLAGCVVPRLGHI